MTSYRVCSFVPGFFHLTKDFEIYPHFAYIGSLFFCLMLCSILLCDCAPVCSSIFLLAGLWTGSSFRLLRIQLLQNVLVQLFLQMYVFISRVSTPIWKHWIIYKIYIQLYKKLPNSSSKWLYLVPSLQQCMNINMILFFNSVFFF